MDEYSGNRPFEVFVNKLKQNLLDMNSIYDEICEHFESVGITGFEKTMMV